MGNGQNVVLLTSVGMDDLEIVTVFSSGTYQLAFMSIVLIFSCFLFIYVWEYTRFLLCELYNDHYHYMYTCLVQYGGLLDNIKININNTQQYCQNLFPLSKKLPHPLYFNQIYNKGI